jgi:hypothetical protein
MGRTDAKVVHVEKTERKGDGGFTAVLKLGLLGGLGPILIDQGGKNCTVTLDDGRVGRGSTQEKAIKDAKDK